MKEVGAGSGPTSSADIARLDGLVVQLREDASIMRKADPSGMQRWNEEYCSSDEACEAGMPDL